MAQYDVTASDKNGKNVTVRIESDSVKNARMKARAQGLTPVSVVVADSAAGVAAQANASFAQKLSAPIGGRVKAEELSNMTRQLATLVKAHVPIVESLTALVEQIEHPKLRTILMDIRQNVKEGRSLGDAFANHPAQFDRVYVNMVRAGESSGRLDAVLLRLADFGENRDKLRNKVMGALMYPLLMVIVGFLVMVVIFIKVVPTITQIFKDQNVVLPLATRILIGISDFMQEYGLFVIVGTLAGLVLMERWTKTAGGRAKKDAWLVTAPLIGDLMRRMCVARFARTMGTLLSSGVPMLPALQITKNVVDNAVFEDALEVCSTQVSEGRSLGATLKGTGEFPPIVVHMVGVGEKSGELEGMLVNVADSYEQQVDMALGSLTGILQPIMIVVMAIVVGFIVMGVLTPIFDMNDFGS